MRYLLATLLPFLSLLLPTSPLTAQNATAKDIGVPCNLGNVYPLKAKLTVSALPRLGTTPKLVYTGPNFYHRGQNGNWSSAVAYMFLGFKNPNIAVGRCRLYSSAELVLVGTRGKAFEVPLVIPNDANLLGFKLYAQGAFTYINVVCLWSCTTYTDRGASNGIELTLGR